MMLKITDEETSKIKVKLNKDDERAMWQTHPQVDKKKFNSENVIGLKNADRPFPVSKLKVNFAYHIAICIIQIKMSVFSNGEWLLKMKTKCR